jgi:plastocyanin
VSARAASRLGIASAVVASLPLTTLALAVPGAGVAGPAEGCSWQRHAKPIVKRVHRHGRLRRVRRVKHWWTCDAQPGALQPQPALPATPTPTESPDEEPEVGHLGVKAVEYSYTLSRPEVGAGEVIVELNNQGEDPHNLVLEHEGSADPSLEIPATPTVSQASARFVLSPGTYRLYCSLYKHEAKGMQATLLVSGD